MICDLLLTLSDYLPKRVIVGGDGAPYLSRFQVLDFGRHRGRLWLHQFHRGDEDRELHNHPFAWSGSLVLAGGYEEERLSHTLSIRVGDAHEVLHRFVERRSYKPGSINIIYADTFHRVHLPYGEAWTLFASGPILRKWGFLNLTTNIYKDSKTFLTEKGLRASDDDGAPRFEPPKKRPLHALRLWYARTVKPILRSLQGDRV
jgi:hypothetical protein